MDLVTRGRLSVQRVDEKAWDAVVQLAENGGWEELDLKPKKSGSTTGQSRKASQKKEKPAPRPRKKRKSKEEEDEKSESEDNEEGDASGDDAGKGDTIAKTKRSNKRRKTEESPDEDSASRRRSTRTKR